MSSADPSRQPERSPTGSVDRTSGPSEFAERLLTVLADGAFTSTYKYAVLLGLVDLCVEYSTRAGGAPTSVTTRQLAERILELYWPQVRNLRRADASTELRESGGDLDEDPAVSKSGRAHRECLLRGPGILLPMSLVTWFAMSSGSLSRCRFQSFSEWALYIHIDTGTSVGRACSQRSDNVHDDSPHGRTGRSLRAFEGYRSWQAYPPVQLLSQSTC